VTTVTAEKNKHSQDLRKITGLFPRSIKGFSTLWQEDSGCKFPKRGKELHLELDICRWVRNNNVVVPRGEMKKMENFGGGWAQDPFAKPPKKKVALRVRHVSTVNRIGKKQT